jgi:hypothetical protein
MTNWLTQRDLEAYGGDLLDVSQRAAMQAVAPHLQGLQQDNADLRARLAREQRHRLDQQVEAAVPNYREIDRDERWHQWLLTPDPLSGRPRQLLLNAAIDAGDASRVLAFFRGFQQQHGQVADDTSTATTLGAPLRRTRSSRSNLPTYTPEMIKQLYEAHRKGAYAGREDEWRRQESDIFAAQREGRVAMNPYVTK